MIEGFEWIGDISVIENGEMVISKTNRLRKVHYKQILQSDLCSYCSKPAVHPLVQSKPKNIPTVDHIIPKGKDYRDAWENMTASCAKCNGIKDNNSLLMYLLGEPPPRHERSTSAGEKAKIKTNKKFSGNWLGISEDSISAWGLGNY